MKKTMTGGTFNRGTGFLVVEARLSNINGDPDMNSDPRMDSNGIGLVSPVSIHRKLRNLVGSKGNHWNEAKACLGLDAGRFDILEARGRDRGAITALLNGENGKVLALDRYWDARLFGCTFLDEKVKEGGGFIRSGVLHFGCGESIRPLDVERLTLTNQCGSRGWTRTGEWHRTPFGSHGTPSTRCLSSSIPPGRKRRNARLKTSSSP